MDSDTQLYELGYIVSPSLTEEEARDFHQKIKNETQGLGALIDEEGSIEKRRLSYPIKKVREAYFGHFKFMLIPEKLAELKNKIQFPHILRALFIKTKRPPQREISTRPVKMSEPATIKRTEQTDSAPPVSVEEIDKKLEEILGK